MSGPSGPPILFPFPPPLSPVAGGLTSPTPFRPRDFTRPPRDLYRVRPGKSLNSQLYSGAGAYGGGFVDSGYSDPEYGAPGYQGADQLQLAAQMIMDSYDAGYRAALDSLQPPAPPAPRATGPTRIYVIPGCYAGNIAPRPERLPAGCDIKRVQILE